MQITIMPACSGNLYTSFCYSFGAGPFMSASRELPGSVRGTDRGGPADPT